MITGIVKNFEQSIKSSNHFELHLNPVIRRRRSYFKEQRILGVAKEHRVYHGRTTTRNRQACRCRNCCAWRMTEGDGQSSQRKHLSEYSNDAWASRVLIVINSEHGTLAKPSYHSVQQTCFERGEPCLKEVMCSVHNDASLIQFCRSTKWLHLKRYLSSYPGRMGERADGKTLSVRAQ